jgi:hypothetical protein
MRLTIAHDNWAAPRVLVLEFGPRHTVPEAGPDGNAETLTEEAPLLVEYYLCHGHIEGITESTRPRSRIEEEPYSGRSTLMHRQIYPPCRGPRWRGRPVAGDRADHGPTGCRSRPIDRRSSRSRLAKVGRCPD